VRPVSLVFALVAAGCLAALLAGCAPETDARGVAITNVTVIDAVNGVRENQSVVFDGDEILAVLPAGTALEVTETIDGEGRYLIPGLWDMHVHLTYDDAFTDAMPGLFLAHGITSVRDTGGLLEKIVPVVSRLREPGAIAPRVYFSGPLLDGRFVVYDGDARPEIGTGNPGRQEAMANVAALAKAGVDFIKIYELVSPEVFDALAMSATDHGLPIAAHVPLSMLAHTAGPQVDSMEHLRNVELDCAANAAELHEERLQILNDHEEGAGFELRSRLHSLQRLPAIRNYDRERCEATLATLTSTIQVPTLRLNTLALYPIQAREDWEAILGLVPDAAAAEWRGSGQEFRRERDGEPPDTTFAEWSLALVGRMKAAGVPIGAGTDTPIGWALPGDSLHTELERLVEAGLTPIEAIEAATVRPAQFLALDGEMGQIAPGMKADLVLLDANPLDDIVNTRRIRRVIAAGRVLDPGEVLRGQSP